MCLGAADRAQRPGSLDRYPQRNHERNSNTNGSAHARTGKNVLWLPEVADPEESVKQSILAVGLEGNVEVGCVVDMYMVFDLCFTIMSSKRGSRAVARQRRATVSKRGAPRGTTTEGLQKTIKKGKWLQVRPAMYITLPCRNGVEAMSTGGAIQPIIAYTWGGSTWQFYTNNSLPTSIDIHELTSLRRATSNTNSKLTTVTPSGRQHFPSLLRFILPIIHA